MKVEELEDFPEVMQKSFLNDNFFSIFQVTPEQAIIPNRTVALLPI